MNSVAEQLYQEALALPDGDRAELVDALIASFQSEQPPPFDDSWREVIQRRSNELQSGKVTVVPWDEVKRKAWEKASG